MEKRKWILVEHPVDWDKMTSTTLAEAAAYLADLSKKLPPDAMLDEHWTGYEDMCIRIVTTREETDAEFATRLELEAIEREAQAAQLERAKAKEKRREEYLKLKREFG